MGVNFSARLVFTIVLCLAAKGQASESLLLLVGKDCAPCRRQVKEMLGCTGLRWTQWKILALYDQFEFKKENRPNNVVHLPFGQVSKGQWEAYSLKGTPSIIVRGASDSKNSLGFKSCAELLRIQQSSAVQQ